MTAWPVGHCQVAASREVVALDEETEPLVRRSPREDVEASSVLPYLSNELVSASSFLLAKVLPVAISRCSTYLPWASLPLTMICLPSVAMLTRFKYLEWNVGPMPCNIDLQRSLPVLRATATTSQPLAIGQYSAMKRVSRTRVKT